MISRGKTFLRFDDLKFPKAENFTKITIKRKKTRVSALKVQLYK